MPETDRWLATYGERQEGLRFPVIHRFAALVLVAGIVGALAALPVPQKLAEISPLLNWGTTFLMAAAVYYFIISLSLAIGMLPFVLALTAFTLWAERSSLPLGTVAAALLVTGVIGLVAGRAARGAIGAVMSDIQLSMIAPLWLLSRVYHRLGIPY
ncbi:MAG: hypothetical protein ACREQZ_16020 [Woeseiaceae bacterium]